MLEKQHRCARCSVYALIVAVSAAVGYFGRNIPMKEQMQIADALFNLAAVIFGIMGAWIALLYPEALSTLREPGKLKDAAAVNAVTHIIRPLHHSTLLLFVVFVFKVLYPITSHIGAIVRYNGMIRSASMAVLFFLTCMMLASIITTIYPIEYHAHRLAAMLAKKKHFDTIRDENSYKA